MQVPSEVYTIFMTMGCNKMHSKLYVIPSYQNYIKNRTSDFRETTPSSALETVNHHILPVVSGLNIGFPKETTEICRLLLRFPLIICHDLSSDGN